MADSFALYAGSPRGPYRRAVALSASDVEIEATAALWINGRCTITVVAADSDTPVTMTFQDAAGEVRLRVKKITEINYYGDAVDTYGLGDFTVPIVIGLY